MTEVSASITRRCRDCGVDFNPTDRQISKYDWQCVPCKRKTFQKENSGRGPRVPYEQRSRRKVARLLAKRTTARCGLTLQEYDEILVGQGEKCAICGKSSAQERADYGRAMPVDHCHTTGLIRGVLCTNCNHGLGCFRDNIDLMLAAIGYLSKTQFSQEEF